MLHTVGPALYLWLPRLSRGQGWAWGLGQEKEWLLANISWLFNTTFVDPLGPLPVGQWRKRDGILSCEFCFLLVTA